MKTIDAIPHEMPNIVNVLRSLCDQMSRAVCSRISMAKFIYMAVATQVGPAVLCRPARSGVRALPDEGLRSRQHHLVLLSQAGQDLGFLAVGDPCLDAQLLPTFPGRLVRLVD